MADDKEFLSLPPVHEYLNVLCIDGTSAVDSAAFVHFLRPAVRQGKSQTERVEIHNLLDSIKEAGVIDPQLKGVDFDRSYPFPFGPKDFESLPIKRVDVPSADWREAVLMPQGAPKRVGPEPENKFDDSDLRGGGFEAAVKNSNLMRRLILAPGVTHGRLDFARPGSTPTDILYLSGHGSMSGVVCGEAPDYAHFFQLLDLAQPEFKALARQKLRAPLWIIMASCFSMRPNNAELWMDFFKESKFPVRGILGYQVPAPLADPAVEISRLFAQRLSEGETFLSAWDKANKDGHSLKWSALVFDESKDDRLSTLARLKKKDQLPVLAGSTLRFYQRGSNKVVKKTPPAVLLSVFHWAKDDLLVPGKKTLPWKWEGLMVTNLNLDRGRAETAAQESDPDYVSNRSWSIEEPNMTFIPDWRPTFTPTHFYAIQVNPPFRKEFAGGFQAGDEIALSLVHVRLAYGTQYRLVDVFEPWLVNDEKAQEGKNFRIASEPEFKKKGENGMCIRFSTNGHLPFAPPTVVLRYREDNAKEHYLWFWFRLKVFRNGKQVFARDLDTFILGTEQHDFVPMSAKDEAPKQGPVMRFP